eukprot:2453639-Prymnesium_polylepis.1
MSFTSNHSNCAGKHIWQPGKERVELRSHVGRRLRGDRRDGVDGPSEVVAVLFPMQAFLTCEPAGL